MKCATCGCGLNQGDEVLRLEEGIIGIRDFVPLGKAKLFCSDECLKGSFNGSQGRPKQLPRRIP